MSTKHLVPLAPFARLIKKMVHDNNGSLRMTRQAVQALQEAAEGYLTGLFEDCAMCATHAKRATCFPSDMRLALRIRGEERFAS